MSFYVDVLQRRQAPDIWKSWEYLWLNQPPELPKLPTTNTDIFGPQLLAAEC